MSAQGSGQGAALTTDRQSRLLFIASCIALVATAMTFAVRGDIIGVLGEEFSLNNQNLGLIAGAAFWGFALSIIIGGAIVDMIGLKPMLLLRSCCTSPA